MSTRSSSIAASSHSIRLAARRLLSRATRPTAVFASNDDMAAGTIMAAHEMGLTIPTRLSVAGFDDSYVAQVIWPRLTTVHQPTYEMAHQAADMLFCLGDEAPPRAWRFLSHGSRESTGPRPSNRRYFGPPNRPGSDADVALRRRPRSPAEYLMLV